LQQQITTYTEVIQYPGLTVSGRASNSLQAPQAGKERNMSKLESVPVEGREGWFVTAKKENLMG